MNILALQRTYGNRAVQRLVAQRQERPVIQRVPARTLFDNLEGITKSRAPDRWNDDMKDLVESMSDQFGSIDIGHFAFGDVGLGRIQIEPDPLKLFIDAANAIALATLDPGWSAGRYGKLLQYLLTGAGTPPGLGSLGKVKIVGTNIEERPGFSTMTLRDVSIMPGQARRHITAWHNIRAFLNKIINSKPELVIDVLDAAVKNGTIDKELETEADELLAKKPTAHFGTFGDSTIGKKVLKAAFIMNSKIRNLWPGASLENSEIATFSKNLQTYLTVLKFTGDLGKFCENVNKYNVTSAQARTVKNNILGDIIHYNDTETVKVLVPIRLRKLEVDLPQATNPNGGALSTIEEAIHKDLYGALFLGQAPSDTRVKEILHYFL